jgi:hypothetical protein
LSLLRKNRSLTKLPNRRVVNSRAFERQANCNRSNRVSLHSLHKFNRLNVVLSKYFFEFGSVTRYGEHNHSHYFYYKKELKFYVANFSDVFSVKPIECFIVIIYYKSPVPNVNFTFFYFSHQVDYIAAKNRFCSGIDWWQVFKVFRNLRYVVINGLNSVEKYPQHLCSSVVVLSFFYGGLDSCPKIVEPKKYSPKVLVDYFAKFVLNPSRLQLVASNLAHQNKYCCAGSHGSRPTAQCPYPSQHALFIPSGRRQKNSNNQNQQRQSIKQNRDILPIKLHAGGSSTHRLKRGVGL